ncbi:MAG: hypothetical protein PQJ50_16570 [Spirochaetales bacterium]|nr:hypothetical protein [Spirochaetales bacterium]
MQIYFLVVSTHLLVGLVLGSHFLEEKYESFSCCAAMLNNQKFKLILGIITVLASLFTLLKVTPNDVVIIGDLLPAVSGFTFGSYLILSFFYESLEESRSWLKSFVDLLEDKGYIFGLVSIVIGVLHFLVPTALIL